MADTVEIPASLLWLMSEATEAFHALEEELEDFLISQNPELIAKLERSRAQEQAGATRSFGEIRRDDQ